LRHAGPIGALLTAIELVEHHSQIPRSHPIRTRRRPFRNSSRMPARGARAMRITTSSNRERVGTRGSRARKSMVR
jgi:hypothetical protein